MALKELIGIGSQFIKSVSTRGNVTRVRLNTSLWNQSARQHSSYSQATGEEPDQLYKTVEVEVKGHDTAVMNSYEKFVTMAAGNLGIKISNIWSPPRVIKRHTLLKSVHIYRKHLVQYEMRTNFRCFEFKHLTGSTANTFLEYIQRNLPEGMAMKVTRHALEALPEHLKHPPVTDSDHDSELASGSSS